VFNIRKTYDDFIHQFEKNEFGYSYFGLLYDNNEIVGSYAVIPLHYEFYNRNVVFGQSVDTMIKKEYRGNPFLLKKLAKLTYDKLKKDDVSFVFGFPNEDIYLVRKRVLGWKDIDSLSVYLTPINIGGFYPSLRFLNTFGVFLLNILNFIAVKFDQKEANTQNVKKIKTEDYLQYRYFGNYACIKLDKKSFVTYTIKDIKGVRSAIIVDINPITSSSLALSIRALTDFLNGIDTIMYIGSLKKSPVNTIKIPGFFDTKKINFCGKVLNKEIIDNRIFNVNNWKINVENFDWI
jgi:hypothetical protein